jgi:hypothetical protein
MKAHGSPPRVEFSGAISRIPLGRAVTEKLQNTMACTLADRGSNYPRANVTIRELILGTLAVQSADYNGGCELQCAPGRTTGAAFCHLMNDLSVRLMYFRTVHLLFPMVC